RRQGVAAHWVPEFQVADADETVRKARAFGGKVSLDAFDLLGRGRLALVLDTTGAPLGLWQPAEGGAGAPPQPKASFPFWPELSTPDAGVAARFYHDLFEWHAVRHDEGERAYATFHSGAETVAGLLT